MDERFLELKFKETVFSGNYDLVKTMLDSFMTMLTGKPTADFLDMKESEQIQILDKKIMAGKVYELFSSYITAILNRKIETESALKALQTELDGEKNGSDKLS